MRFSAANGIEQGGNGIARRSYNVAETLFRFQRLSEGGNANMDLD